jgi:hypothetical protein
LDAAENNVALSSTDVMLRRVVSDFDVAAISLGRSRPLVDDKKH